MTIHDRGTYEADKWRDDEIGVTFHGDRTSGRYVFFQTGGNDWMVRRMDPAEPGWEPMPDTVRADAGDPGGELAGRDDDWGYEMSWGGRRTLAFVSGGRVRLQRRRRRRRHLVVPGDPAAGRRAGADRGGAGRRDRRVRRHPAVAAELLARRKPPTDSAAGTAGRRAYAGAVSGL